MKRHKLTPEERTERDSQNAAFAQYHAEPDRWAMPEKGTDNRWHLNPCAPPPLSPSGFAPPFREEVAETTTGTPAEEPRMSMTDFLAMRSQSHAPPSPGSAAKAAQLHEADKLVIDAKVKKVADKRKAEAAKKAEAERLQQAQGSLL